MTQFDPTSPLTRIAKESRKANAALRDYWLMAAGRSLGKLIGNYQNRIQSVSESCPETPPTLRLPTLKQWSVRFHWQKRIAARQAIADAEDEDEWERRRTEQREREWTGGLSLFERAEQIAKLPYVKGSKTDHIMITAEMVGQEIATTTIVEPLNVSAKDEAALRGMASKLGRLASGMESDRQTVVLQMQKEVESILDIAQQVLNDDSYSNLLAALSGDPDNSEETLPGEEAA